MGKGSLVLGVLALFLSVGGLGLGGVVWISVARIETQVLEQNAWYNHIDTNFITNPSSTYITYSDLAIEFVLGPNEAVYFSFTSRAHIEPIASNWARLIVYFKVDGIFQSDPLAEAGMYDGDFMMHSMLHLQAVRTDLSAGVHNVTVVIYGTSTGQYIWQSSLYVQKVSL